MPAQGHAPLYASHARKVSPLLGDRVAHENAPSPPSPSPRRMVFKKDKEREKAATLVKEDAMKMSNFFQRLSHATNIKVCSHTLLSQQSFDASVCVCVHMQYTQVMEELGALLNANQEYLALDIAVSLLNKITE